MDIEEGEARYPCSGRGESPSYGIDPDVDFSYIDEKLHLVLGHFQRDFEDVLSREKLGAKFGCYGSFLPVYQVSPSMLTETRSTSTVQSNNGTLRSQCNKLAQAGHQNGSLVSSSSLGTNNVPAVENSEKKDNTRVAENGFSSTSQCGSSRKIVYGGDPKSLKVCIKMGTDSMPLKDMAAIYSGLGLDISPSSSEESPPRSGSSPEFASVPDASPNRIVHLMTTFQIPGGLLLSPLQSNITRLGKKQKYMPKRSEKGAVETNFPCKHLGDSSVAHMAGKYPESLPSGNDMKPTGKRMSSTGTSNSSCIIDKDDVPYRDVIVSSPEHADFVKLSLAPGSKMAMAKSEHSSEETGINGKKFLLGSRETRNGMVSSLESITSKPNVKGSRGSANTLEGNLHIELAQAREAVYARPSKTDKVLEEEKQMDNGEHAWDPQSECVDKNLDIDARYGYSIDGRRGKIDRTIGSLRGAGQLSSDKNIISEQKSVQVNEKHCEYDDKCQPSQTMSDILLDGAKRNSVVGLSKRKHNKDISCSGSRLSGKKARVDVVTSTERNLVIFKEPAKNKPHIEGNIDVQLSHSINNEFLSVPSTGNIVATTSESMTVTQPDAAPVVNDNWVECEKCGKWRLLPYWVRPSSLPDKWHCKMITWLPGMNRCKFSEEDTTKAVHAMLYAATAAPVPAPAPFTFPNRGQEIGLNPDEHADIVTSVAVAEKKHCKGSSYVANNLGSDDTSMSVRKRLKGSDDTSMSVKKRPKASKRKTNLEGVDEGLLEMNPPKVPAIYRDPSSETKSKRNSNKNMGTQRNLGMHSDGEYFSVEGDQVERPKSNAMFGKEHPGMWKKSKIDEIDSLGKQTNAEKKVSKNIIPVPGNVLHTKVMLKNRNSVRSASGKEICASNGNVVAPQKKLIGRDVLFPGRESEIDVHRMNSMMFDDINISPKRRKIKGQSVAGCHLKVQANNADVSDVICLGKDVSGESKTLKGNKPVIKPEQKDFHADSKLTKDQLISQNLSMGRRPIINDLDSPKIEFPSAEQAYANGALQRDIACTQRSTLDATSSSSKVSCSPKSKSNCYESRPSPVESVSSSPTRIRNMDNNGPDNMNHQSSTENIDHRISAKVCFNSKEKLELSGRCNSKVDEGNMIYGSGVRYGTANAGFPKNGDGRQENLIDQSAECQKSAIPNGGAQHDLLEKMNPTTSYSDKYKEKNLLIYANGIHHNQDKRSGSNDEVEVDSFGVLNEQRKLRQSFFQDEKPAHVSSDHKREPEHTKLKLSGSEEQKGQGTQMMSSPVKGKSCQLLSGGYVDTPAGVRQQINSEAPSVLRDNASRQATPGGVHAPGQMNANTVLKEARDLKHMANRLKNEAQESTGLYFQAALKFLKAASLMEPPGFEYSKLSDATRCMQMYSETAKLSSFCAHEYERSKEMLSAALAYKCVEVAYLKAAFYNKTSTEKDQHELQKAIQTVVPGESPSSSASDIDYQNNQNAAGNVVTGKLVYSPQIAGNHVFSSARNNLRRLLDNTKDINSAFEATRKSHEVCDAASEKGAPRQAIVSVKKVLDFSFHNVDGLLQLLRQTMESIGIRFI